MFILKRTGISATYAFDAIKEWHNSKPIDPNTGYKRPTVVNMSWGYRSAYIFDTLSEINYRGISYTSDEELGLNASPPVLYRKNNYGLVYSEQQVPTGFQYINARISSVDTDIDEMVDAGIHVTIAAGNSYFKIDLPGGPDFDNYVSSSKKGIFRMWTWC